jgi:hypothetical protein
LAARKAGGFFSNIFSKAGPGMLKGASSLVKFAGPIGAAIGVALGVSSGLDKFYDQLDPKFNAIDRKVGAAAAGILDTLTFGLLPDSWGLAIAQAVTSGFEMFNSLVESFFGKNFAETLRKQFGFIVDTFDSIGDLIGGIFSGDSDKIGEAIQQLIVSLGSSALNGMKFLFVDGLAALGQMIFSGMAAIAGMVVTVVKGIFNGIVDTLGSIIESLLGPKVREWWDYFVNPLKEGFDNIKSIVVAIPQAISDAIGTLAGFANTIWQALTGEI